MEAILEKRNSLSKDVPAWFQDLRDSGAQQFKALGLPTAKNEAWKYTSIKKLAEIPFELGNHAKENIPATDKLPCTRFEHKDSFKLCFLNGHFAPSLSNLEKLPEGIEVLSLRQALKKCPEALRSYLNQQKINEREPFAALNTALLHDGAWIRVKRGVVIEAPIELYYFSLSNGSSTVSHPRTVIVAEPDSQVTIIENYAGKLSKNPYWTNAVTEIYTQARSFVRHYKIQDECEQSFHLSSLAIQQEQQSNFTSTHISIGARLSRHDIFAKLQAVGAECNLNGLYMVHGKQHVDYQTKIDHAEPNCHSRELFKGILDDHSHGVFNGQILVQQDAQKTLSNLTNNNLLLSRDAIIDTKPLLEIFADDVKCSHGATIGRLDENQIFYLRSRGIEKQHARHLLTYAFASEIIRELKNQNLRNHLEEILLNRLKIHELSIEGEF